MLSALITLLPGVAFLFGGTPAEVPQTIRRTLAWGTTTPGQLLELSNTRGDVRIVAEDRSDVSIVATRTVDRQGDANEPGPDVDFRQESGRLLVCGDNSHCGCHVDWSRDGWRGDERTRVRVDFDVRVPRQATLDVCAVNGGRLRVEGTEGRYTLRHVNGAIEMVGVRGAGRASTVNGDLRATFVAVPNAPAEFKTVNGRVDVTLPATLSADLRLRTLHGGLYTDFDTTPLPSKTTTDRRTGRLVYRSDRFASVRVGSGGPELTFETVNGDVQVRKR
jgi:hypothetical protein